MDWQDRRQEPRSGIGADALWSAPLPSGGGLLTPVPSGGCVASTATPVSVYASDGRRMWEAPTQGGVFGGEPILTSDGAFVRIEDGSMVVRALDTGEVVGLSPAMLGSGLCLAPWGDLLYSRAAPGGTAAVHCVTRTGQRRWSVPLDGSAPLGWEPFGLGEVVVVGSPRRNVVGGGSRRRSAREPRRRRSPTARGPGSRRSYPRWPRSRGCGPSCSGTGRALRPWPIPARREGCAADAGSCPEPGSSAVRGPTVASDRIPDRRSGSTGRSGPDAVGVSGGGDRAGWRAGMGAPARRAGGCPGRGTGRQPHRGGEPERQTVARLRPVVRPVGPDVRAPRGARRNGAVDVACPGADHALPGGWPRRDGFRGLW
jgi:hypothetical protein